MQGLTGSVWSELLQTSRLRQLEELSIPVLFQTGDSPDTQFTILDYDDLVYLFTQLPSLKLAKLHR